MWTLNSEIPFSNNLSERSLRNSKTKMKVSGQFTNLQNAQYFVIIKSYLETGYRHKYSKVYLIECALDGSSVTVEETKKHDVGSND